MKTEVGISGVKLNVSGKKAASSSSVDGFSNSSDIANSFAFLCDSPCRLLHDYGLCTLF